MMSFSLQAKNQKSLSIKTQPKDKCVHLKSDYIQEYEQFFRQCSKIDPAKLFQKIIHNSQIKIYQNNQYPNPYQGFKIISIKPTSSTQIYEISVNMFPFYTKLSVLFHSNITPLLGYKIFAEGSYGIIYLAYNEIESSSFVIKSTYVKRPAQLSLTLLNVIKQYTISLIMSALGVGPKLTKDFGFDILVYQTSIQYSMQLCSKPDFNLRDKMQLIQNLAIMHSLHIVHLDLKPQNIAYSNFFNKWVFLDYGFSEIVHKKIGFMTLTGYIGSFQYSSPQMRNCLQAPGYVDLYYNDVFGLQACLNYYEKFQNQSNEMGCHSSSYYFNSESMSYDVSLPDQLLTLFKFYIYKEDYKMAKKIFKQFSIKNLEQELIYFLQSFFPSNFLKKFYYENIHEKIHNQKLKSEADIKFKRFIKHTQKNSQQNTLIKENIQKFKVILYELSKNCQDQQGLSNIIEYKQKINPKQYILDKKNLESFTNEEYLTIFFNYVTFQQNKFDAALQDKQKAAKIFIEIFQISPSSFLGYQVSQPQLKELIICIKFILDYCEEEPWNQMKIQLYPKVCAQFALINPDIFTKNHPKNYIQGWYRKVYEQNSQDFFRMFLKFFKIRQAYKYVWYQDRQIQIQNYPKSNITFALSDLWQNKQYLVKHLKNLNLLIQFLDLIEIDYEVNGKCSQFSSRKFSLLQAQIISNSSLSKQEKSVFLVKLVHARAIRQIVNEGQAQKVAQMMQKIYSYINFDSLSEQMIQLCLFYSRANDLFNVRQIFKAIDSNINCEIISKKILTSRRIYTYYFLGNRMKSVQLFQHQIEKIRNYELINEQFYIDQITFSSILMSRKDNNNKYEKQVQAKEINQTIVILNSLLIKKMKKVVQNIIYNLQKKKYTQKEKVNEYYKFYQILSRSIKYFVSNEVSQKQFFYQVFQIYKEQLRERLINAPYPQELDIDNEIIVLTTIGLFQQCKLLELLLYLYSKIQTQVKQNTYNFQFNRELGPVFLYVKVFKFVVQNPSNKLQNQKQLNSYDSRYKDKKEIIQTCCDPTVISKLIQLNILLIERFYNYFTTTLMFGETFKYNSPNHQILSYFYKQKQFKKFFAYIFAFTKYVSNSPNPIKIHQVINNICHFYIAQKVVSTQFSQFFQRSQYHKLKVWQNPYWWLTASIFCFWVEKCSNKILFRIAQSFPYIIYEAKRQILQTLYGNALKNIVLEKNIRSNFIHINEQTLKLCTPKMFKLLRQHYKYFCQRKISPQQHFLIKIGKIQCKQRSLKQKVTNSIKKKIISFHENIGNI